MIAVYCIKVIWVSFLSGNQSDNQDGHLGAYGVRIQCVSTGVGTGVIRVPVRQSRVARDFIMLLSVQFKTYALFVSGIFYLIFLGCRLTLSDWNHEK